MKTHNKKLTLTLAFNARRSSDASAMRKVIVGMPKEGVGQRRAVGHRVPLQRKKAEVIDRMGRRLRMRHRRRKRSSSNQHLRHLSTFRRAHLSSHPVSPAAAVSIETNQWTKAAVSNQAESRSRLRLNNKYRRCLNLKNQRSLKNSQMSQRSRFNYIISWKNRNLQRLSRSTQENLMLRTRLISWRKSSKLSMI